MWGSGLPEDSRLGRVESGPQRNQWHSPADHQSNRWHYPGDPNAGGLHAPHEPEEDESSGTSSADDRDGTWGESDVGGLNQRMAMEDYEALRRNLTNLSRTRSQLSRTKSRQETGSLYQTLSRVSGRPTESRKSIRRTATRGEESEVGDVEAGPDDKDEFELDTFMREGHFEKRVDGRSAKKVGVVYKNLTVKGIGSTASFDFTGVVRDGEMMLVLGRPGSGCSTFLKAVSNNREGYAEVTGEVSYGGIPAVKQKKMYRGEVNYNPEDDVHFATLNVWKTLTFALMTKTKKRAKEEIPIIAEALMKIFGISHTKHTLVGDEYTRGVSGGERKRVSIAETLASKSTLVCWDNSTRGLDASTALDYAKSLRIMTDISNRTTLVTLYQAGEGIFDLMDKVLVIDEGRCVFQGPAKDAKQYFINLGYYCPDRQTTPDFLTAVTDPTERRFRDGCEASTPKTPDDLERAFRASDNYKKVLQDIESYEAHLNETDYVDAKEFEQAVQQGKSKRVPKKSSYTVSFHRQVWACTLREFWLIFGDTTTLYTKLFIIISNGLIVGSLFYGQPLNTEGAFSRGGTAFFSILFLGWLQLTELMKAVSGRAVVARHKDYAFYRPSAVSIARVVTDIPILFVQVVIFGVIMYFLTGLDVDVSKFRIYLLFVYVTTLCITALYR
ncbi:ATP-binding cassette transporter snq2, partial [Cryomyces antarcticus]